MASELADDMGAVGVTSKKKAYGGYLALLSPGGVRVFRYSD